MMEKKKPLIILTGPTAVGKTEISLLFAKAIGGEIISADSIQVYKYMDIGSAKITKEEMQGIPHFLIDELYPDEEFNVVIFQKKAKEYIEQIYQRRHIPVIVGGTGFYIQAVLYGIDFEETAADKSYREELEMFAKENGVEALHNKLKEVDEKAAEEIHANNKKRVIRALEYYKQTGCKISEHNEEQRKKCSPYQFVYFVLNQDRDILYKRINERVDKMMEKGLLNEVEGLLEMGYQRELVSMQGIGYKEVVSYLEGEISLEEAVDRIKKETRHFAKRQITWFKRESEVTWIEMEKYFKKEDMLKVLLQKCREKGVI
jgi:tRNA dimethylallyltransferase